MFRKEETMENTKNSSTKFENFLFNILIGVFIFNIVLLAFVVILDGNIWFSLIWGILISGLFCLFGLFAYIVLLIKKPNNQQSKKKGKGRLIIGIILFLIGSFFSFFNMVVIILINL